MSNKKCATCGCDLEPMDVLVRRATNDHEEDQFDTVMACPNCAEVKS